MPFGDGTGPLGLGPMTGRGAGFCAGFGRPGFTNPIPGRWFGLGWGWRAPWAYPHAGYGFPYSGLGYIAPQGYSYGYPYYGPGYTPPYGYPYSYPGMTHPPTGTQPKG